MKKVSLAIFSLILLVLGLLGVESQIFAGIKPLPDEFDQARIETPVEVGIGVQLGFESNSDRLTAEIKSNLDNLGEALESDQFSNSIFRIEGHTSAIGNEEDNLDLSQRRAESVKNYLVDNFKLDARHLKAVGRGSSQLFDPANPAAAVNNRIQFVNEVGRGLDERLGWGPDEPVCQFQPGHGPEMVVIPAGELQMGSNDYPDELPIHPVRIIRPFALSRCEITFADYQLFTEATGDQLPDDEGWGQGDRPVINVSWDDAVAYAEWLSQMSGRSYRLPTEAEWEYAARGGTQTGYWWGDEIGTGNAVCGSCGSQWDDKQTAPAGSFKANPFGLYDTAGNVWEWVQDCSHDDYQGAPFDGSAWAESDGQECGLRVLRGGSWSSPRRNLHSANRNRDGPADRNSAIGFRLAQDI